MKQAPYRYYEYEPDDRAAHVRQIVRQRAIRRAIKAAAEDRSGHRRTGGVLDQLREPSIVDMSDVPF